MIHVLSFPLPVSSSLPSFQKVFFDDLLLVSSGCTLSIQQWSSQSRGRERKQPLVQILNYSQMARGPQRQLQDARRAGGEGNGTPLQYSCLENPMDRGAC